MTDLTDVLDRVVCADALTFLASLPSASVDMVLCDLPYGTTACSWDEIIPFAPMWEQFTRVSKPRAAIVLTASQPFTSKLVMSNLEMFRYEWIWDKASPVDFLNVNIRPMKQHESILVFSDGGENYYPQWRAEVGKLFGKQSPSNTSVYGSHGNERRNGVGYPLSILRYPRPNNLSGGTLHPNQKPHRLFEYLIRTYTQAGDVVLDCCMGSGTTAVAARQCGRHFVGCDNGTDEKTGKLWATIANDRLAKPWQPLLLDA